MDIQCLLKVKEEFGMQNNNAEETAKDFLKRLRNHFGNRVEGFAIYSITDQPYKMFSIKFTAYFYFKIIFNYDRGRFGCSISYGEDGIALTSSQEWYDKADMNIFFRELEQQIELRIPDKFLKFHGWK